MKKNNLASHLWVAALVMMFAAMAIAVIERDRARNHKDQVQIEFVDQIADPQVSVVLNQLLASWKAKTETNSYHFLRQAGEQTRNDPTYKNGYYFAIAVRPCDVDLLGYQVIQLVAYAHTNKFELQESSFVGSLYSKSMFVRLGK